MKLLHQNKNLKNFLPFFDWYAAVIFAQPSNGTAKEGLNGLVSLGQTALCHGTGKEIGDMARQEKTPRQRMDKGKKARPLPQEEVCRCAGKDAQRGHTEYMKDMMEYQYEE